MMKKIAIYLIAAAAMVIVSCNDEFDKESGMYKVNAPVQSVSLDQTTLTIVKYGTATLKTKFNPERAMNQSVTWSSSNEGVATVTQTGEVTAREAGTATITVTTEDGGKTATCAVTVTLSAVTGVSIPATLTINVDEERTITATVSPANASDQSLTWSSSDPTIATVSEWGDVKGLKPGKTTITAASATVPGAKAECELTVLSPVTGVTLDKDFLLLVVGGSATVEATISPADASNKDIIWSVSSPGVSIKTDDGQITVTLDQEVSGVIVKAVTADGGFEATCEVSVTDAYSNALPVPFDVTLADNFQYGDGYSGSIDGSRIFVENVVRAGSTYELEMEFTVSRDFENTMTAQLVDPSEAAGWWGVRSDLTEVDAATDAPYKAGATIKRTIRIVTTEATTVPPCNLYFETIGAGTPGTGGSGVKGAVKLTFSKFVWSKIVE
jgi:uncharacterized protein YjdB